MDKAVARISPKAGEMEVLSGDRIRLTTEVWSGIYEVGDKVQIEVGGNIIDFRVIDMHFGDSIWEQITTFKRIPMNNIREDKKQLKRAIEILLKKFELDHNENYAVESIHVHRTEYLDKNEYSPKSRIIGVDVDLEVQ